MSLFEALDKQRNLYADFDFSKFLGSPKDCAKLLKEIEKYKEKGFGMATKDVAPDVSIYNNAKREIADHTEAISKNAEITAKTMRMKNEDAPETDLKTILNPDMIGLRLPKTDLDHLKDFSRVFNLVDQHKQFEMQDTLVSKLQHFLYYLAMVKLTSVWKPHMSRKDIFRMQNNDCEFSRSSWLNGMILCSGVVYQSQIEEIDQRGAPVEDSYARYTIDQFCQNPNWEEHAYSIWDSMCVEELLTCSEKLSDADKLSLDEQKARVEEVKTILCKDANTNEYFKEVIWPEFQQKQDLSKSKLELLDDAKKFSIALSNMQLAGLTSADKIQVSLLLADLTHDVNHVLGALIYIVQAMKADFEKLVTGEEMPQIKANESLVVKEDFNNSILTINDLEIDFSSKKQKTRSKSALCSKSRIRLQVESLSDSKSVNFKVRSSLMQSTITKPSTERQEVVVRDDLISMEQEKLIESLADLGGKVDLTSFFKRQSEQELEMLHKFMGPKLKDVDIQMGVPSEVANLNLLESEIISKLKTNQEDFSEYLKNDDVSDGQKSVRFLEAATILCQFLTQGCEDYLSLIKLSPTDEKSFYEKQFFFPFAVNQQRETFHNVDRLSKLLLSFSKTLQAQKLQESTPVKFLSNKLRLVSASVTGVFQCNLVALVTTQNNMKLDQILSRGDDTKFSGLSATRSKFEMLMEGLVLKTAFNESIKVQNMFLNLFVGQSDPAKAIEGYLAKSKSTELEYLLPMVYEIITPDQLNRVIDHIGSLKSEEASCPDWDIKTPGFLNSFILENLDLIHDRQSNFAIQKLRRLTDSMFDDAISQLCAKEDAEINKSDQLQNLKKFVLKYHCLNLISIIESNSLSTFKREILKTFNKLASLERGKMTEVCLYMTFQVFLTKKEMTQDQDVVKAVDQILYQDGQISSDTFMSEFLMIKGTQLVELLDLEKCTVEQLNDQDLGQAQTQIMQSQLLSGGLPLHLYAQFDEQRLDKMRIDACLGVENDVIINQLDEAKQQIASGKFVQTEDENFLHEVIHKEQNPLVDIVCEALQQALKRKGGQIALSANAGQNDGLTLTRAAFAIMIKFRGLHESLKDLIAEAGAEEDFNLPSEQGAERNEMLVTLINDFIKGEEILNCWSNATKMRRWLMQKKQTISTKHEFSDDKQNIEATQIKEIIDKIVKKAEFLSFLQAPNDGFKSLADESAEGASIKRRGSLLRQTSHQAEEVFDLKKTMTQLNNMRAKEIGEASTTSVLACLQTPIQVYHIINQIALSSHRAIRRLSAFQKIKQMMELAISTNKKSQLKVLITWMISIQDRSNELQHYTDGLTGCGTFFENKLKDVFCPMLQMIAEQLAETKDESLAQSLILAFNFKFKAQDFQFLSQRIQIFPLLFRGGSKNQKEATLISKSISFYHADDKSSDLCIKVQSIFKELFMAIIGRISHGDSLKQMQLDSAAPKLARRISLLDTNWSEQIIVEALTEVLSVFQKCVEEHQLIDTKRPQIMAKVKLFANKKTEDSKLLKELHKILYGSEKSDQDNPSEKKSDTNQEENKESDPAENDSQLKKAKQNSHDEAEKSDDSDVDKDGEEKSEKDDDKSEEKVLQKIHSVYNEKMNKLFLNNYISMIYLLSNVAQIEKLPRQILLKIITPDHLRLLVKFYEAVDSTMKLRMLKLFSCLIKLDLPRELINQAFSDFENNFCSLALNFQSNKAAGYLIDQAVKVRNRQIYLHESNIFDVSKQMLRLVQTSMTTKDEIKAFIEKSITQITDYNSGQRAIVFELLGCALETFCLEDQVRFHRKLHQVKQVSSDVVMVIKNISEGQPQKLKVFSSAQGKEIKVHKREIQIVQPEFITVSDEAAEKLVSLLPSNDTDWMTKAQIVKFFLQRQPNFESVSDKLVQALIEMRGQIEDVEAKAKTQFDSKGQKKVEWQDESLSIIMLEEHLMQQTIAMLHDGAQFLKIAEPKNKANNSEEEDNDSDEDKTHKNGSEKEPVNIKFQVPEEEEDKELDDASSVKDEDKLKSIDDKKEESSGPYLLATNYTARVVLVKNYFKKTHPSQSAFKHLRQDLPEKSFMSQFNADENCELNSNKNKEFKERNLKESSHISALILSFALVAGDVRDQWVKLISYFVQSDQPISKLRDNLTCFVRRCNMRRLVERHTKRECLKDDFKTTKDKVAEIFETTPLPDQFFGWIETLELDTKNLQSINRAREEGYHGYNDGEEYYDGGEGEGAEADGFTDFGEDGDGKASKKILKSTWDKAQIISKMQFLKAKRPIGQQSSMTKFHEDSKFQKVLCLIEQEGCDIQNSTAVQILTLKLTNQLEYMAQKKATQKTLNTYVLHKVIKMSNCSFATWNQQSYRSDQQKVKSFLRSKVANQKEIMEMSAVTDIFESLDNKLFKDTNLSLLDFNLVAQIELLRKVADCLAEQSCDVLLQHATKMTDGLLKAVWWMTNQMSSATKEFDMLLLKVRKTLGSLLNFTKRVCSDAKKVAESGVLCEISNLQSLKELEKLLPDEYGNVRNLLQIVLAETYYKLFETKEKALSESDLTADARTQIENVVWTFEKLYLTMRYTKACLSDTYLTGAVKNQVKEQVVQTKFNLQELPQVANGWYKIETGKGNFSINIDLKDKSTSYWGKAAISPVPRISDKTTYHELTGKDNIKIGEVASEVIYLKYPLTEPVMMTLQTDRTTGKVNFHQLTCKGQKITTLWNYCQLQGMQFDGKKYKIGFFSDPKEGQSPFLLTMKDQSNHEVKALIHSGSQQGGHIVQTSGLMTKTDMLENLNDPRYKAFSKNYYVGVTQEGWAKYISQDGYWGGDLDKLHSEIPQGQFKQIASSNNFYYVLTKTGDLYQIKSQGQKLERRKMKKPTLRDGSHIVRYTKVECNLTFEPVFAEGLTSKDETVIVSCGVAGNIARKASQDYPETEFHLLDNRYKFPYWKFATGTNTVLAIDESGEIWILKSSGSQKESRYCPELDPATETVKQPTKTSLMKDKNMKALRLVSTQEFLMVEAESLVDQKKHVIVIEWDAKHKPLREKMQAMIEKHYDPISDQFEIALCFPSLQDLRAESVEDQVLAIKILMKQKSVLEPRNLVISVSETKIVGSQPDKQPVLTDHLKAKNSMLLKRWQLAISAQFRKQTDRVFKFISKNQNEMHFVLKFFKQFVKVPTLDASEWTEQEESKDLIGTSDKSLNDCMKELVSTYLHTAQLLYDLTPFIVALGDDNYIEDFPEGLEMLQNFKAMSQQTHIELIQRAVIQKIIDHMPAATHSRAGRVRVRRILANDFKLKNRYETASEACTMFTQFMKASAFKNPEKWKTSSRHPFSVSFINENSYDCGGPMRDAISNLCSEVMSDVLPLLQPTGNNSARVEPQMDSYILNPKSLDPSMLQKFTFLGYFLGWSLRNMGGLAIDLPIAFWRRICKGSQGYVYTLADLHEIDKYQADLLKQIQQHATDLASDQDFEAVYDGYMFEASFGSDLDSELVELCPGGSAKQLTRSNADKFVELYLQKFTEQDQVQFQRIWLAIQDCVGERTLRHMTGQLASNRACSKAEITPQAFKASCRIDGQSSDEHKNWTKWFWEIFGEMSKQDRQLLLKFMSGNSRINQGVSYSICIMSRDDGFPVGHTCGNSMDIPCYKDKETMKRNMLTAFQLCGEIDMDGDDFEYGNENNDEYDSEDDYHNENRNDENAADSDVSVQSVHLRQRYFPIYSTKTKSKKQGKDDKDFWALDALDKDDEANAKDIVIGRIIQEDSRFLI